jgi:hypothetical protein
MATNTVPNAPDRLHLCVQAAYRIEALAHLLKRNASNDSDEDPFVIEELSTNIAKLAGIVMSAAGDENDPTKEIAKRLYQGGRGLPTDGPEEQQAGLEGADTPAGTPGLVALELERLNLAAIALMEIQTLTEWVHERLGDDTDPYATNVALKGLLGRIRDLSVATDECIEYRPEERTDNKQMLRVLLSRHPTDDELTGLGPDQYAAEPAEGAQQ